MELEVGMYFTYKIFGMRYISKVIKIYHDSVENHKGIDIFNCFIIKSSFNIIDLIEVGDYVNGWLVSSIHCDGMRLIGCEDGIEYDYEIKEVLTKEQYKSGVYKID